MARRSKSIHPEALTMTTPLNVPVHLSAREQRVATLAASLAREFAPGAAEHDRSGAFAHTHYRRLHEAGYLRLALPRDFGGEGANLFEMVLAQERLAQGDAATAVGVGMLLNVIGRMAEEPQWPQAVFGRVCETIARDGGLINSVVTEPDLGSISRGGVPATSATPVPGGWLVSGHKIFVTAAPALRFLLTAVQLPPSEAAPQGEVARAIIEAPANGLRFEATWQDALSQRSGASDDAYFDQVFVAEERMVERAAIGAASAAPGANGWWLTLVAVYLGIAQAAVDAACDYANERVPSVLGQPIAGQPHIQHWIGRMQAGVISARAVLYDTARRWTQYPLERAAMGPQVAAAKHLVTNTACEVTDIGLRVAGGFSLTRGLTLERHFRDARGGLFQPPQDDLALGLLGRTALAARRELH
jgi:alkylation response protein AidB-like acyl-CoA dehydrogenase